MKNKRNLIQICLLCAVLAPAVVQAQFQFTTNNGTITITGCANCGDATIPGTINGFPVTSIGGYAFYQCTYLTSVTIPNSITNIESYAFDGCTRLSHVWFTGNAPNLGISVFSGDSHATVYYPPGMIGWDLIYGGLPTALWLPSIPYSYTITNGTITITGYHGSGGAVVVPNKIYVTVTNFLPVSSIGDSAFEVQNNLTSVTIPNSITSIGDLAFLGCSSLTNVTISNSITNFGTSAFEFCTSLISVTIPNGVTSIGSEMFLGCSHLTNVTIPNSVTSIGGIAFENCTSLTSVTIPDSVITIPPLAFFNCSGLTNLTIGNNVTSIDNWAFELCSNLTSVTIPNSVTILWPYAFDQCSSLTNVYFQGNAPSVDSTVFRGEEPTAYYLPGTTGWGNFSAITGLPTAPWMLPNPTILNFEPNFGVQTNCFGFTISWATNIPVVVEACTDLANPVWTPVATNTLTGGSSYFSDEQWTNYPGRFYRIRSVP